jgi:superfamily II DNA helicase RecQ
MENLVHLSVFGIVLDALSKFDKKYWAKMMTKFLRGSSDAKMTQYWMDQHELYWALSEYNSELVESLIEALIQNDYLEKTTGQYPLLGMTKVWYAALKREDILIEDESNLQQYLLMRVKSSAFRKAKSPKKESSGIKKPKWATYKETLQLYKNLHQSGPDIFLPSDELISQISEERGLWKTTIESHIVTLYENWDVSLNQVLKLVDFGNLKKIKSIITDNFSGKVEALRPVKDLLDEKWEKDISYFEIKLTVAMLWKGDL